MVGVIGISIILNSLSLLINTLQKNATLLLFDLVYQLVNFKKLTISKKKH
jgi:hypothetical protein